MGLAWRLKKQFGYLHNKWNHVKMECGQEVSAIFVGQARKKERDRSEQIVRLETMCEKTAKIWAKHLTDYEYVSLVAHVKKVRTDADGKRFISYRVQNVYSFTASAEGRKCFYCSQSLTQVSTDDIIQAMPGKLCAVCNYREVSMMWGEQYAHVEFPSRI